jgi:D-alanyl-D-alanine carboxypeptidase (penicillin-binding protein 5/6)
MSLWYLLPLFLLATPALAVEEKQDALSVKGASYIVIHAESGEILLEKNSREKRAVASTQKLLTALIAAETGDLWRPVTIPEEAVEVAPTKLYLKSGEVYSRYSLLKSLLVKSPNDAAASLAYSISGDEERFGELMTKMARYIGAKDSQFKNASGLPAEGQYSTARDMAIIARAAYSNPVVKKIVGMKTTTFKKNSGELVELTNTNRVLQTYRKCTGMKTGYTRAAGNCLVASADTDVGTIIAVILGSDRRSISSDMVRLLSWGEKRATEEGLVGEL